MFKIFASLLTIVCASFQISAQCGVHFEETGRQAFSNSFANAYFEDFDGDGLEDLFGYSVTRDQYAGSSDFLIHYYKRLSSDSFDVSAKSSSITNVHSAISNSHGALGVIGDVNADGKKDLIATHMTGPQTLVTYLNDGEGRFVTTTPAVNTITNEKFWAAGDLNNDGKADVLSTTVSGRTSTLYYRLAEPDDRFGAPVSITTFDGYVEGGRNLFGIVSYLLVPSYPVLVEDLNNDGLKDIALVEGDSYPEQGYRLHVLTNNGSLKFNQTFSEQFGRPITRLRTYDLNNDGKKDFVSNPYESRIWRAINNGDNTFSSRSESLPFGGFRNTYENSVHTKEFSVADLDNDGDIDILYPGTEVYVVLKNQGDQTFIQQQFKPFLSIDANVNLDSDGKGDAISLIRPLVDGLYRIHDGNNYHYFSLHSAVAFKRNVCRPAGQTKIVDFNGDGTTDRTFWTPATGIWRSSTSDDFNSSGNGEVTFQWGLGSLGDVPVPNDFDGDGKTDRAVFRRSDGTWWIYKSSDGQYYSQHFGISEDKPVPADYDGDGKADIAVFRPSTGDWHIWLSETSQYMAVYFGISEDKPVPIDYDGDGKADIAVYRPSTGTWYRINSSDNSFVGFNYGISTDKPLPADYDGDGKANIAVFRDGIWYVLRADLSTTVLVWGIANDEPFFHDSVESRIYVHRRSTSVIYFTNTTYGGTSPYPTGGTVNDVLASSTLPPNQ